MSDNVEHAVEIAVSLRLDCSDKFRMAVADIENADGKVVLMASNFGSIGEDLRVSFFYRRNDGEGSPFHQAVVSGLDAIEGANLNLSASETDANPCGEN